MSVLFEQVANIAKAHNADIYAKQVQELKESNIALIEAIETLTKGDFWKKEFAGGKIDNGIRQAILKAKLLR